MGDEIIVSEYPVEIRIQVEQLAEALEALGMVRTAAQETATEVASGNMTVYRAVQLAGMEENKRISTLQNLSSVTHQMAASSMAYFQAIMMIQQAQIWVQWREEQVTVTRRRLAEYTEKAQQAVETYGASSAVATKALEKVHETEMLVEVYTNRLARANTMLTMQYVMLGLNILPMAMNSITSIMNAINFMQKAEALATATTWGHTMAQLAKISVMTMGIGTIAAVAAMTWALVEAQRAAAESTSEMNQLYGVGGSTSMEIPGAQGGMYVTREMIVRVHPGETIQMAGRPGGGGGGNVFLGPIYISGVADVKALKRALDNIVSDAQWRSGAGWR